MTKEERDKVIKILKWLHDNDFLFKSTEEDVKYATELAIKTLERDPCDDAVSREFMYKLGAKCIASRNENGVLVAIASIENLPSVTPQPKTGHWIYKQYGGYPEQGNYHCSECDKIDNRIPAYCSNCGCHMVEPTEMEVEK